MYIFRSKKTVFEKARAVKLLLLDVDGVLTGGDIVYGKLNDVDEPMEIKSFDVHDGYGIVQAIRNGIIVGIITARNSKPVQVRAAELGITDLYQGSFNKLDAYEDVRNKYGVDHRETAYMGDDIFDLPVLNVVGLSAAPSNARPEVKRKVDYISKAVGGKGAVRELIDVLLKAKGLLPKT
jgi:3-deoxy-D-manno-octulosonate 8-phosphate phosphatase (KDO 8-P phosphatase)